MISLLRHSAWTFNTSSNEGLSISFLAAEHGTVVLNDPAGKRTSFSYWAGGGGLSIPLGKLAKFLKSSKVGKYVVPRLGDAATKMHLPEAMSYVGRHLPSMPSVSDLPGAGYVKQAVTYVSKVTLTYMPKSIMALSAYAKSNVRGGGSTEDFTNTGAIWITEAFKGQELTRADISGVCIFLEVSAVVGGGGSATAMLLGCRPRPANRFDVMIEDSAPGAFLFELMYTMSTAQAVVIFGGEAAGLLDVGGAIYIGELG